MGFLFRAYCKVYQKIIYLACFLLDFSEPECLKGTGSIKKLPDFIKSKGFNNVLIVTDGGLMKLGLLNGLFEALKAEGVDYSLYDKTVPNPTVNNIEEGVKLYKENNCQAIVAFGGGSSMDCAKGIGARIAKPKQSVNKMGGVLKIIKKTPTMFAIPTTAGTGSETTLAAVITDSDTHFKYAINDPVLIPDYAVLDPELTLKLPKHITSTTGMDALTHAVEAYIGHSNTKKTKMKAENATKLIFDNIKLAYDDGSNIVARENMQIAAFDAGVAFTRAYVGIVHAIAHSLGGQYGVPHGLANAVILPHALTWFGSSAYKRLAKLATIVGIEGDTDEVKAKAFIQAIKDYNAYMNIPEFIDGIKVEDIPTMAEHAYKECNPLYPVPRFMSREEFIKMYYQIGNLQK